MLSHTCWRCILRHLHLHLRQLRTQKRDYSLYELANSIYCFLFPRKFFCYFDALNFGVFPILRKYIVSYTFFIISWKLLFLILWEKAVIVRKPRSSRSHMFYKIGGFKNFAKFPGKPLRWSHNNFIKKDSSTGVFR